MELDPKEIYEKLTTLGEAWADAQYSAELLDETRKPLMAQLGMQSEERSAIAKENFALSHPRYREHIEGMVIARKMANKAKVKYDAAKIYADLIRTVNANHRAAMRSAV